MYNTTILHFSTNGIIKHGIIFLYNKTSFHFFTNGIIKHGIILQYFISLQMV